MRLPGSSCGPFSRSGRTRCSCPLRKSASEQKASPRSGLPRSIVKSRMPASISEMLAALYLAGHNIDWIAVHADSSWRRIPLPTYPFQRKRHWIEDDTIHASAGQTAVEQVHPLVGKRINSAAKEVRYEARYSVRHAGYLSDHRVGGTVVLPTTAELEAAMVVGRMHFGTPLVSFDDAMHHQAMSFANGEDRIVQLVVTPLQSGRASFSLVSAATEDPEVWHTHMTGTLRKSEGPSGSTFSMKQVRGRCQQTLPAADFYVRLEKLGLEYGPSFRGIRELYFGEREALTKVRLPEGLATAEYVMHPAFLDACLHAYPLVLDGAGSAKSNGGSSYLPVSLGGFRCYQDGVDQAWVHTSAAECRERRYAGGRHSGLRRGGAAGGRAGRIGRPPVAAR